MEHSELILEMPHVEQMPTQERLLLARKRRNQQLKVWTQKEKEFSRKTSKQQKSNKRSIFFNDSVVLLEAAARNDIDEGNDSDSKQTGLFGIKKKESGRKDFRSGSIFFLSYSNSAASSGQCVIAPS